jgi:hypothetical protein
MPPRKVPSAEDWAGYKDDLDVKHARGLFFGRTTSEVLHHFGGGRGIERASELLYMPRRAFQYYVFAFAEFLTSDKAAGESDDASSFLRLLIGRERQDPGSVAQIYVDLEPAVDFVSSNQVHFDADLDIYGDFRELASQLRTAVRTFRGEMPNTSLERTRGR